MIIKDSQIKKESERNEEKQNRELNAEKKRFIEFQKQHLEATEATIQKLEELKLYFDKNNIDFNEYLDKSYSSLQLLAENVSDSILKRPEIKNDILIDNKELITHISELKTLTESQSNAAVDKTELNKKLNSIIELLTKIKDKKQPMFVGGGGGGAAIDTTRLAQETTLQEVKDSIDNIEIDVDNINIDTDDIEVLLNDILIELQNSSSNPIALVAQDLFGSAVSGSRYNQVEIDFSTTDPDAISTLTVTKTVGGDASNSSGQALFTTGTNTNSGIKAVTNTSVEYRPHAETYAAFTAIFTAGIANSYQRIGLYDTNNGFFIGYEGTSFGVTKRSGAVDTTTAKASFSEDTLSGQSTSKYTRNGVPEAIDLTKDNLFRIRFGWLGAAPIYFEVFSPDGDWVVFHKIKYPNTATVPAIQNPNLPITLDVKKTGGGSGILAMRTACWAAGTTSDNLTMTHAITDNTLAPLSRSVIAGRASSGGGTYYNVKVNPSGALETNASITGTVFAEDPIYYKILDDTTTLNMIYIGEATPGTATSAATWRIKRLNVATGLIIQWAGSGAFTQIWDNRAALVYN